jgi:hypothetical protein
VLFALSYTFRGTKRTEKYVGNLISWILTATRSTHRLGLGIQAKFEYILRARLRLGARPGSSLAPLA